jgi:Rod binding domain-containing protein
MYIQPANPAVAGLTQTQAKEDKGLQEACQEFESVFLSMIWKEMQKSSGTDLGGWDAFAEQAIGQHWARNGGIGLAKVIYKGMSKHLSE